MLFACKCLNVTLVAPPGDAAEVALPATGSGVAGEPATGGLALIEALTLQQAKLTGEQLLFLQKAVGALQSVRVTVNHPDLVQRSHVGSTTVQPGAAWELNQCIGCDVWTHATDHSGQLVLVNPETLTNAKDILYLSSTAHYSRTFRLLLNQSQRDQLLAPQRNSSDMAAARQLKAASPRNAEMLQLDQQQQRHRRLTQHFRDAVQLEIEATDERIRAYTEGQFAELQRFRERALADYQQLCKLAATVRPSTLGDAVTATAAAAAAVASAIVTAKPLLETTPPATPDAGTPMSIGNSPNFCRPPLSASATSATAASTTVLASSLSAHRAIPFKPKTSPLRFAQPPAVTVSQSYGGGGVIEQAVDAFFFEMDGVPLAAVAPPANVGAGGFHPMVQHSNSYMSDVEESDSDDSSEQPAGEGRAIPRSQVRPKSLSIAQSMPISMPMGGDQQRASVNDDDDYDEYAGNLDDGVDIAASIKALARSVHGDAVFGDLPRPRFSTQI